MGDDHISRVLVTGDLRDPIAGEMLSSYTACYGYKPEQDLKSGLATVWPEFAEAGQ